MASTNKTTNYELSQYIGTDKPTYLTDYNQDMTKIDAGIHAAKSEADTNASSIGDLTSLTTTAKTSLVAAANEIDADVATNTNNIATNTSNIATNTTHIGTVANLTTSAKTDLVVAANEINAKVGNLSNLKTDVKTNLVSAVNEVKDEFQLFNLNTFKNYSSGQDISISGGGTITNSELTVATNSDGSIFKFYGQLNISNATSLQTITLTNTGLNPTEEFSIVGAGYRIDNNLIYRNDITVKANGDIEIKTSTSSGRIFFIPCLYFAKDFGDVPANN